MIRVMRVTGKTCTYLRYGRAAGETEAIIYRCCEQQHVCKSHPISRVSEAKEKMANKKPLIPPCKAHSDDNHRNKPEETLNSFKMSFLLK